MCVPRGVDLPVVVLAVWWAGGVYVPLDPSLPAARLAEMAGAAGVSAPGAYTHLTLATMLPA
ncbi:AMP-binding protein [Plantactinospora sp. BB1]|uniref:AMP-binding protein n=1 Tax=Plantactinospora sp. BB1 TaxID=2071627 RepID=UPI000D17ADE3